MPSASPEGELDTALRDTLLELVKIESPIGEEKALADWVAARIGARFGEKSIRRLQHSLVVNPLPRPGKPRVALVGHLDTVRTVHEGPPRIEGDKLFGAGAADMKAGLAIMLIAMERMDLAALPFDLTFIFYEREEGPFEENMLGPVLDAYEDLRTLDFAICLEPSDNKLQLGCMGSVHVTVRFQGRTAHSARPWQGENAILKAGEFLSFLAARQPKEVVLDGYTFREVISPTLAKGGRGRNVVPDQFELNLNYRFAPGRTPGVVADEVKEWVGDAAVVIPTDLSPAGRPHATHELVNKLKLSGVETVEIKQAWTDVARFDSIGVPAVNFGPGTQSQAHQKNEWTELSKLYAGYRIFEKFLAAP